MAGENRQLHAFPKIVSIKLIKVFELSLMILFSVLITATQRVHSCIAYSLFKICISLFILLAVKMFLLNDVGIDIKTNSEGLNFTSGDLIGFLRNIILIKLTIHSQKTTQVFQKAKYTGMILISITEAVWRPNKRREDWSFN